jgi:hypothetical protein
MRTALVAISAVCAGWSVEYPDLAQWLVMIAVLTGLYSLRSDHE